MFLLCYNALERPQKNQRFRPIFLVGGFSVIFFIRHFFRPFLFSKAVFMVLWTCMTKRSRWTKLYNDKTMFVSWRWNGQKRKERQHLGGSTLTGMLQYQKNARDSVPKKDRSASSGWNFKISSWEGNSRFNELAQDNLIEPKLNLNLKSPSPLHVACVTVKVVCFEYRDASDYK